MGFEDNKMATKLLRSLNEARALLSLGLPIIVAHFAVVGMSLTDTVMAGQAGVVDLAGLAVSVNLWIPLSMCLIGVLTGIVPLTAQYRGANQHENVTRILRQASWLGIGGGLLVAVLIILGLPIVELLAAEPPVTQVAQGYLFAIAFGLPALLLDIALHSWLEGMGKVRPIMFIGIFVMVLNIPLDYALVLGKWGLPALGGAGCGWATAFLCWVGLLGTLIYIFTSNDLKEYRHHLYATPQWKSIKQILKVGIPLGLTMAAEEGFISVVVLISLPLGTLALGGLQVMATYMMLIVVISVGFGQAITIRVAHALGQGNTAQARFISYQGILWNCIIIGMACALGLWASQDLIALFSEDENIKAVALGLMWLTPFALLADAILQSVNGALRGFKDTFVPMLLLVFSYWGIAVPVAFGLIHSSITSTPLGVTGSYISYIVGFSCGALLLLWRMRNVLRPSYRHSL